MSTAPDATGDERPRPVLPALPVLPGPLDGVEAYAIGGVPIDRKEYRYAVNDLYASVQGEGVMTGVPMLVLRMQGCPVACRWCDTKETWALNPALVMDTLDGARAIREAWAPATARVIAERCVAERNMVAPGVSWILLTGGEPAAWPIGPLVDALHAAGFRVAIETSGTHTGHVGARVDHVCVSPKMGNPAGLPIRPRALMNAAEVKWVIGKSDDVHALDLFLSAFTLPGGVTIAVQPMSQSVAATRLCMELAASRGWRVSVQVHKYLDIR